MINTDRANQARALANFAESLLPGEQETFSLDDQFHGRELEIIEGAENILKSEGEGHIALSVETVGVVSIQA